MITADQPSCFSDSLTVGVSSTQDGQMQHGRAQLKEIVDRNRQQFLSQLGLDTSTVALVNIRYGTDYSYDVIEMITTEQTTQQLERFTAHASDCIMTNQPNTTLFLPVADCVATVVYDPTKHVVALAHLGRHSSIAKLASKVVEQMHSEFQSSPADLVVWMSPAIQPPHYTIARADFATNDPDWNDFCTKTKQGYSLDLQGYNKQLFINAGVASKHIHRSLVDTATDKKYWSHFTQTTVKEQPEPPRFAVAVTLNK